jgi:hypothetical protein
MRSTPPAGVVFCWISPPGAVVIIAAPDATILACLAPEAAHTLLIWAPLLKEALPRHIGVENLGRLLGSWWRDRVSDSMTEVSASM